MYINILFRLVFLLICTNVLFAMEEENEAEEQRLLNAAVLPKQEQESQQQPAEQEKQEKLTALQKFEKQMTVEESEIESAEKIHLLKEKRKKALAKKNILSEQKKTSIQIEVTNETGETKPFDVDPQIIQLSSTLKKLHKDIPSEDQPIPLSKSFLWSTFEEFLALTKTYIEQIQKSTNAITINSLITQQLADLSAEALENLIILVDYLDIEFLLTAPINVLIKKITTNTTLFKNLKQELVIQGIFEKIPFVFYLWLAQQKPKYINTSSTEIVRSMAWKPEPDTAELAYFNSVESIIKIYDIRLDKIKNTFSVPPAQNPLITWVKNNENFYIATLIPLQSTIVITDPTNKENKFSYTDPSYNIKLISRNAHNNYLAYETYNKNLAILDINTKKTKIKITHSGGWASALIFSPDGKNLAYTVDNFLYIWNIESHNSKQQQHYIDGNFIASLAWNPDSTQIAVAGNNRIVIFDLSTSQVIRQFTNEQFHIKDISWSPNGKYLALTQDLQDEKNITMLDLSNEISFRLQHTSPGPFDLSWSPDGDYLACASTDDGAISVWKTKNDALKKDFRSLNIEHMSPIIAYYFTLQAGNPLDWKLYPNLLTIARTLPDQIQELLNLPPQSFFSSLPAGTPPAVPTVTAPVITPAPTGWRYYWNKAQTFWNTYKNKIFLGGAAGVTAVGTALYIAYKRLLKARKK